MALHNCMIVFTHAIFIWVVQVVFVESGLQLTLLPCKECEPTSLMKWKSHAQSSTRTHLERSPPASLQVRVRGCSRLLDHIQTFTALAQALAYWPAVHSESFLDIYCLHVLHVFTGHGTHICFSREITILRLLNFMATDSRIVTAAS